MIRPMEVTRSDNGDYHDSVLFTGTAMRCSAGTDSIFNDELRLYND